MFPQQKFCQLQDLYRKPQYFEGSKWLWSNQTHPLYQKALSAYQRYSNSAPFPEQVESSRQDLVQTNEQLQHALEADLLTSIHRFDEIFVEYNQVIAKRKELLLKYEQEYNASLVNRYGYLTGAPQEIKVKEAILTRLMPIQAYLRVQLNCLSPQWATRTRAKLSNSYGLISSWLTGPTEQGQQTTQQEPEITLEEKYPPAPEPNNTYTRTGTVENDIAYYLEDAVTSSFHSPCID